MRTSSPAEHTAFAKLTALMNETIEVLTEIAALRPDQPWTAVIELFRQVRDRIYRVAEAGLRQ